MHRVLYLEDEKSLVEDLPTLLREKELEVVGTTSVSKALTWISEQHFDAVLLDIQMPPENIDPESVDFGRETGVDVARRIKNIKPEIPIVAFTVVRDTQILRRFEKPELSK